MLALLFLALGILLGFLLRRSSRLPILAGRSATVAVYLLLLLLGLSVGSNQSIMSRLGDLGWQALLLSLTATAGSVLILAIVAHFFLPSLDAK